MSQEQFKKFINPKNNAAIKEKFKQEKKTAKKERAAAINKRFEEKRALRNAGYSRNADMPALEPKPDKRQKYPQGTKPIINKSFIREQLTVNGQMSKVNSSQSTNNKQRTTNNDQRSTSSLMPLNKYIAHCGITSRRDAIPLIKEGRITVNGTIVTEPGFKVTAADLIMFNGKKLFVTKNQVYILLNKPKDYITTTDDPQGRKTVLQLISQATSERVYPIGRLDRNTSGVLLFTNDGELTQMLTHPSYNVKKVYEAKLDKPLTKADFDKILNGLKLEDGEIYADALAYADSKDKSIIGIEIHSGRNRIVRRIFEHLGYEVKALDRVMYANLTKKNVERGKWRYLSEREIRLLKFMNAASSPPPQKEQQNGKELSKKFDKAFK
ncbi:MAG: pseudouridine synthase [Ginsengibacter sp.]